MWNISIYQNIYMNVHYSEGSEKYNAYYDIRSYWRNKNKYSVSFI